MKILSAKQPLCLPLTKSLSITEAANVYIFEHSTEPRMIGTILKGGDVDMVGAQNTMAGLVCM